VPIHVLAASASSDMFNLTLPVLEKIARPVFVYFFLIIGLRIAGKRELAQLNPFDLVVLLMLSNTVQNAIIGDDSSLTGAFIGAATLLALNYAVVRLVRRSRRLQRVLEGRPDVLIRDGEIQRDHLDRELITRAELVAAAHKQGISSLKDVERCVLEPTGTISFILKRPTHESARHEELRSMLELALRELTALRAGQAPPAPAHGTDNAAGV
jgi:uncharacterized membrane protein YcaP (DUF421 family)